MKRQSQQWEDRYEERLPSFRLLEEEARYAVSHCIRNSAVKIDSVESRVKALDSIARKATEKGCDDPLAELVDIVGIRVICLFKSGVEAIDGIIRLNFIVESYDNKLDTQDAFGYMSVHYICRLQPHYSGPRYDAIKDMRFEIQVRTLCMHAWAVVSHYLSYKNELDIPAKLKKSFLALSGLFYVADEQFENAFNNRAASREQVATAVLAGPIATDELNIDTLEALLKQLFPDRAAPSSDEISKFLSEISKAKYNSLNKVRNDIIDASSALGIYEEERRAGDRFEQIGAARVSLAIANALYRKTKYGVNDDTARYHSYILNRK